MNNVMEYQDAKSQLIQAWGTLGTSWGINKTMAQIHALLLISPKALSTEDIMKELNISRGNANMNIRALLDWGVIKKQYIPGDRKEYFSSEKDIWELARIVAFERRKRELQPIIKVLHEVEQVKGNGSEDVHEFRKMTSEIKDFVMKADQLLDRLGKIEKSKILKFLLDSYKK
ncbi:MAG TPA: GbsR/MarR family transcriptional regulator [Cyclobacteriaceae bacterium]